MTITPDTKDWTWVLWRRCEECGFDARTFPREQVGALLRDSAATWQVVLTERSDASERPRPDKWSTVEYACHVRDVFQLYTYRLDLMLTQDDPEFRNWDQDEAAVAGNYHEQDPVTVAAEIGPAAEALAAAFDAVHDDQWERPSRRSDGATFTVETFARYFIHDPIHHLYDIGEQDQATAEGGMADEIKTRITQVRTVGVPVTDQDRALEFYTGTLGFDTRMDATFGGGQRWIEVAPAGAATTIALMPTPVGSPTGVDTGIRLSTTDADADHADLLARGVDVDAEVIRWTGVPPMFMFRDPDGNTLVIVQLS